jgi:glycosyltransferase involved in cell wall biosynthesis
MRILFIARRYPPHVGGMERFAKDLSSALEKEITVKRITWAGSNALLPVVQIWFFLKASYSLTTDRSIQVIHMQDAVQAPIGWLLSRLFRRPYVVVAHGLDITYPMKFYQLIIIPFVRKADSIISISSATRDEVLARKVDSKKTTIITLGTHDDYGDVLPNRSKLNKSISVDITDRKLLLTTGRLVERKGVAWFVKEVLPVLVNKDPSILYLIAGDGSERQKIERTIEEAGFSGHAVLLGRVSDNIRSLLYQSCDIFVMPNIVVKGDMEGFGIVAHEAATAELPVVASDIEGIKDAIVDGKNGILVDSLDKDSYVREIQNLLEDDSKRKKIGTKARKYTLESYSWSTIAESYINIYKEME